LEEEGPMKKSRLFFVILGFLVLSLAGVSYGWQGRMGGMGDPYGLVPDESDFLFHPAGIANGKGVNYYSNYRFNFTDVMDWNYTFGPFPMETALAQYEYNTSGDERGHDGLLGAAFPLGAGRMGLFFQYSGRRDNYGGDNYLAIIFPVSGTLPIGQYGMDSDLDAFALRLLYGHPMGGFKIGGEIQLAYRHEKNDTNVMDSSSFSENDFIGLFFLKPNVLAFMRPYDSKYWEAIFKGSLKGAIGPAEVAFTLRGGLVFSGENHLMYTQAIPSGVSGFNLDGNVKGWNIGGDLWLRYPLASGLSLPFILRVDYQKKTRDGDGPGVGPDLAGFSFDYKNRERNFQSEVGGGVDKEFGKGTRVAAGIYYGFLQDKNDLMISLIPIPFVYDFSKYPNQTEHRVILKIAGEKEISPMVAIRMGVNFFYGWAKEDFNGDIIMAFEKQSMDGYHWGIGASLGGTVKFQRFSVEPFIGGGYQKWNLDGTSFSSLFPFPSINMDKMRQEWFIGGGLSIKF
jgi:hypothetical protein